MKKRVLYVWKDKYPWDVRAEKICKSLINAGYEVFMLARNKGESKQFEVIDNIQIIRVGSGRSIYTLPIPKNPLWAAAIKDAITTLKPDIVIVREIMLAEASARIAHKHSIPILIDMAENYPAAMRDWKKYNKNAISRFIVHRLKVPDLVEKRAVQLSDGIIVVCQEQIKRLEHQYNFSASKICIVHNTPDLSAFRDVKFIDTIPTKPITFCHHGYLSAEKSIENLLLGFEIAADKCNIRLIIAGDGECIFYYKNLVAKFKHKNNITFLGNYDYHLLPKILANIDIGVIPYQISDFNNFTIHNKIFDYFACGKPVLTSLAMPLIRIMDETKAGLAMDFSSAKSAAIAIETILSNDLITMSANSLKAAQNKYNWNIDAGALIDFVNKFYIL